MLSRQVNSKWHNLDHGLFFFFSFHYKCLNHLNTSIIKLFFLLHFQVCRKMVQFFYGILQVHEVWVVQSLKIQTLIEIQKHIVIFGYCIQKGTWICTFSLSCSDNQFFLTPHWNLSRIWRILQRLYDSIAQRQYTKGIHLYIQELFLEIISV